MPVQQAVMEAGELTIAGIMETLLCHQSATLVLRLNIIAAPAVSQ